MDRTNAYISEEHLQLELVSMDLKLLDSHFACLCREVETKQNTIVQKEKGNILHF